jgi:hypothetical protein
MSRSSKCRVPVLAGRWMLLLSMVAMLGCGPVAEEDLIGTWRVTDSSRELLPEEVRGAAAALVLAADGTFTVRELPTSIPGDPSYRRAELLTGHGEWSVIPLSGSNDLLDLAFEYFESSEGYESVSESGRSLTIRRGFRSLHLVYTFGDPDVVPHIVYARSHGSVTPES